MIERVPLMILALSLMGLWSSMLLGAVLAKFLRPVNDDQRKDLDLVVGSSLTILGLIIGFTFSMAVSRYDMRKNYEEEEANAIGTEYVRVDLLPGDKGPKLRQLLIEYLDQRILFYKVTDQQQLNTIGAETTKLQDEMWSAAQIAAKELPNPVTALAVGGMNDVLNRQGYTQAAWWNRIPVGAWALMISFAFGCSILVGYSARHDRTRVIPILPCLVAIAFFLIADIDSPRRGVIHVRPQNLESLAQSLHGN